MSQKIAEKLKQAKETRALITVPLQIPSFF